MNLQQHIQATRKAARVRNKVKAARSAPEEALHRAVAEFLSLAIQAPAWWTTFPSGSGGKARGGQLKAKGLKAGCPDILIIRAGLILWIELKAPNGVLSDAQKETIPALEAAGCECAVCRSVDEVERALLNARFNLKARAA